MSAPNATPLYVAVRTNDQKSFNTLMDQHFEQTGGVGQQNDFVRVRNQIPQRWDVAFRKLLFQWMCEDSTSVVLCQNTLRWLGVTTLRYGDAPHLYEKISLKFLLNIYPVGNAAVHILSSTVANNAEHSFAFLLQQTEMHTQLDLPLSSHFAKQILHAVTADAQSSYYTAFWNNLPLNDNWRSPYLLKALFHNNTQAVMDLAAIASETDLLAEVLEHNRIDVAHMDHLYPCFPIAWRQSALTYLLAHDLISGKEFSRIKHLDCEQQSAVFNGVAPYIKGRSDLVFLESGSLPSSLDAWVFGEKNPIWGTHIFPTHPQLQHYILHKHTAHFERSVKKSKL